MGKRLVRETNFEEFMEMMSFALFHEGHEGHCRPDDTPSLKNHTCKMSRMRLISMRWGSDEALLIC